MKRLFMNCLTAFVLIPLAPLYSQEAPEQPEQLEQPGRKLHFISALGINLFSNSALYLIDRYIMRQPWAQISFDSIKNNFISHWVWDSDEYFTNQFGHPYQGSIYHAAARASGFSFYESILFDVFGSAVWELIFETNTPSMNDLISTTIGGASLGEMLHRLYLEIPSPFAAPVSPADALAGLLLRRRNTRKTTNIYSLDTTAGAGYIYARQATGKLKGGALIPLRETHAAAAGVSCDIVYGNPYVQQSWTPYKHFELSVNLDFAYPFWYNFNIQSNAYLFSFNVLDDEIHQASTGLSLHYDLFTDRHINFFAESLDWTFKYIRAFNESWNIEFKCHLGGLIFNVDNSYFIGEYTNFRQGENNYGTGINIKIFASSAHTKRGKISFNVSAYEVFNVFRNNNPDSRNILFVYLNLSYAHFIGEHWYIGAASSVFRNTTISDLFKDTDKGTYAARLFVGRAW